MKPYRRFLTRLAIALVCSVPWMAAAEVDVEQIMAEGDAARGRLVFGTCRTCHYPQEYMGHNNGPNLHRIFGKVAGKQEGFEFYSDTFKKAEFVWTPELMFAWLEDPARMFPDSTMMSLAIADPQKRADLIAYLKLASQYQLKDSLPTNRQQ